MAIPIPMELISKIKPACVAPLAPIALVELMLTPVMISLEWSVLEVTQRPFGAPLAIIAQILPLNAAAALERSV
jgi:hypothetical protein